MLRARVLLAAALLSAGAAGPAARAGEPEPLRYDLAVDVPLTAAIGLGWILSESFKEDLARAECRICGTNAFDAGARDLILWGKTAGARRASDVLAFGVLPLAIAAHSFTAAPDAREGLVDLAVIVQAATFAASANQLTKYLVARQRPFVHYGNYDAPDRLPDSDDNLSFFSGHTTLAFSLAAAAGTVASMRGYDEAPWVWAAGMTLATAVAYFRVAGDRHWVTDVLTGAAIGTAIGAGVPRLLHAPRRDGRAGGASITPILGGVVIVF